MPTAPSAPARLCAHPAGRAARSRRRESRGWTRATATHIRGVPDIGGGAELSSFPAHCTLSLERRTLPGETGARIEAELEAVLEHCRAAGPDFVASQRTLLVRDPFEIDPDHAFVALVADAAGDVLPDPVKLGGGSYWADSSFIAAAGIPTVLFGPGGEGAHAVEEWVSLPGTDAVARTLVGLATRFCA